MVSGTLARFHFAFTPWMFTVLTDVYPRGHFYHFTRISPNFYNHFFDRKALLEPETRARRTGRETSDCNSRARLGRALD